MYHIRNYPAEELRGSTSIQLSINPIVRSYRVHPPKIIPRHKILRLNAYERHSRSSAIESPEIKILQIPLRCEIDKKSPLRFENLSTRTLSATKRFDDPFSPWEQRKRLEEKNGDAASGGALCPRTRCYCRDLLSRVGLMHRGSLCSRG